ncbi:MAG TPA: polyhydroxyalkanoic acid system family protein [Allosphingosinicella sp.]|jgi:hypothetical protein
MNKPVVVDLPHRLGAEEAKSRMQRGIGKLKDFIPGGNAEVQSSWQGDRMILSVKAMGQEVSGNVDVHDTKVRLELMLPPLLAMLAGPIEAMLRNRGTEMLEDKSGKS